MNTFTNQLKRVNKGQNNLTKKQGDRIKIDIPELTEEQKNDIDIVKE